MNYTIEHTRSSQSVKLLTSRCLVAAFNGQCSSFSRSPSCPWHQLPASHSKRWRRYVSPKYPLIFNGLQGDIFHPPLWEPQILPLYTSYVVDIEIDHSRGLKWSSSKIKLKHHLVCTELMIRVFVRFATPSPSHTWGGEVRKRAVEALTSLV
jgi:hypothetical protein